MNKKANFFLVSEGLDTSNKHHKWKKKTMKKKSKKTRAISNEEKVTYTVIDLGNLN